MIEVVKYSYSGPERLFRGSKTAIFGRRAREHGEKIEGASRKFRSHTLIYTFPFEVQLPHIVVILPELDIKISASMWVPFVKHSFGCCLRI
jgi:hypothetical protein